MNPRRFIGLASGSSTDAIKAVLIEASGSGMSLRLHSTHTLQQSYPRDLRELIRRVCSSNQTDLKQLCLVHRLMGESFAAAARQIVDRASLTLELIQCLGCAGHLLWHDPEGRFPSTFALGMPAVIAERTGITTISDFCGRDVALGGQGAPLAALPEYLVFRHATETRVLIHLGGPARLVYLPANCRPQDVMGFEVGPCNLLLDGLMRRLSGGKEELDHGGKHGVQGRCQDLLLQQWLAHPYLHRRPPKSMPRQGTVEEFIGYAMRMAGQADVSVHDLLCTAAHFVARSVAFALERFLPAGRVQRVILSGGGSRNGLLWRLLEQHLPDYQIAKSENLGVASDTREALDLGILAALTIDGIPANLPGATGALGSRLLGNLTPGSFSNWARCVEWMANHSAPMANAAA
jgi:anhydro-N-acetylmuramic acid kinase